MAVPVVHRVCAGGKRLSALTSVRCGAGILAIHHVGGDGKDGGGGDSAPVGMVALDETHEGVYQVSCQLVHAVIVISIFREISLYNIVCHNTLLIAHGLNLCVLDGGQGVSHNGKSGNTGCKPSGHLFIMKGHLKSFIAVFVVVVVDDVKGVDIYLCKPFHHVLIFIHDLVVIQVFRSDGAVFGSYLFAGNLVHAAIDGV